MIFSAINTEPDSPRRLSTVYIWTVSSVGFPMVYQVRSVPHLDLVSTAQLQIEKIKNLVLIFPPSWHPRFAPMIVRPLKKTPRNLSKSGMLRGLGHLENCALRKDSDHLMCRPRTLEQADYSLSNRCNKLTRDPQGLSLVGGGAGTSLLMIRSR